MVPDPGSIAYNRHFSEFERRADEDGDVAEFVKRADADAVDGGRHQDVCFHADFQARLGCDYVGCALSVGNDEISFL